MNWSNFKSSLFSLISDIRFAIITLTICSISIAAATFIENEFGSNLAFDFIYNNTALYLLFIVTIACFIAIWIKFKFLANRRYAAIFIHSAFIVILTGAVTTHYTGREGSIHLREGETSSTIIYKDGCKGELSYSITLKKFEIEYYEGNEFPLAYKSNITINRDNNSFDATISVNNILRVNGDRIYQLSYDQDLKGSTLLINNDFAGTTITYIGYVLLLIGFIFSIFGKKSRIKDILKAISTKSNKAAIIIALLSMGAITNAKNIDIDDNALIPVEDGKKWESVFVLSNNGIIEPLECHARTILRKITHSNGSDKEKWGARLYMSLISFPEIWCNTPIIYCPDKLIAKSLNIRDGKYVSFNALFDENGAYKLNSQNIKYSEAKELKKLDERVRIFSAIINCSLLKIFPSENGDWCSTNNTTLFGKDSIFASSAIALYIKAKIEKTNSNEIIDHITAFQEMKCSTLPSSTKKDAAIIYSKVQIFKVVAFGYIILGIILLFFAIKYANGITFMQQIKVGAIMGGVFAIFLLHTLGISLRWYVSEQPPWSNTYETMLYIAWCITLGGLLFMKKNTIVVALSTIMAAVTLFISSLSWLEPVVTPLMPVLNSPWLILHVTIITASYGFFGISAITGVFTLLLSFKRNSTRTVKELTLINEFLMYIGLILVTAGTFLGAVWANLSWGRYWGWDAKESWALITIFVYTIVTHLRLVPKFKNDIIWSALSIFATASVLMTYFGVNYYLSGLHSYGNNDTPPAIEYIIVFYILIAILTVIALLKHKQNKGNL